MQRDTLQQLADLYERHPGACAQTCVSNEELDNAANRLGVPFAADYREFVTRFGGGHAGALPVAGLRRWEFAGNGEWSVVEVTERHRAAGWPGTEAWVVFSGDGFGNPVGFDKDGQVWLSDHDSCECVCLEASFEDWLRRWALQAVPHRSGDYLARWPWPPEALGRLGRGRG
jgi:hypothetical protein